MRPIHAAVLLSTWALLGCQEAAHPPPDTRVHLLLTDAPLGDAEVTRVLVTFTRVDVYSEVTGAWEQVIDYGPSGRTFDLLTLRGGNTEELGAFQLPPGTYDQIRLELNADNQIEVNDGAGPELLPLTVPSGEQTGIKLVHAFTVDGKGATEIVVDFDAEKSVKRVGHGWQVQPVIHIVSTTTSEAATRVIGPAGGTVRLLNEAQVDIPPGALSQETEISIQTVELPAGKAEEQGLLPSSLVELGPNGTTFAVPVTVTVWYDPAELRGRSVAHMTFMTTAPGGGWVRQPAVFDTRLNTCTGTTAHFSPVGSGAAVEQVVPPTISGGPFRPTHAPFELTAQFLDINGQDLKGVTAAWTTPPDGSSTLQITTDYGCSGITDQTTCQAQHGGRGCYWLGLAGHLCIPDNRYATVTPLRHPGASLHIHPWQAASTADADTAPIDIYGLRVKYHDFYVQDDSNNFGPGAIYWLFAVNGQVVWDHNDSRHAKTGDTVPLLDFRSPVQATGRSEGISMYCLWGDDDSGIDGSDDLAWFNRTFGWDNVGQLPGTVTDSNNGNGSLDIHLSAELEEAM